MYCCFSGPLGGGGSVTEKYLHVCTGCHYNQFEETSYGYDGSAWADCSCLICRFHYGELLPQPGEWRVRDLGSQAYGALSMPELEELLNRNIHPQSAEMIREELQSRQAGYARSGSATSSAEAERARLKHRQVALLAYQLWLERGRPVGSPEADWFAAEAASKYRLQTK
jgi:hypothetical protein